MEHKYKLDSITVDDTQLDILDKYTVEGAQIFITIDGRYLVSEPRIPKGGEELYDQILKKIDVSFGLDDAESSKEDIAKKFEVEFWDTAGRLNRRDEANTMFRDVQYYIRRDIIGYGILDTMMNDSKIEDILCSAYGRDIRVNHSGYSGTFHTLKSNVQFPSESEMEKFIQRIYGKTGSEPTESRPISVTYMEDGSRISCTFGSQVSKPGPIIAIRKFPGDPLTITHMVKSRTISAEAAAYIWTLLDAKAVGMVIGITGSGKTTLMSTFMTMLNPNWRIVTIEDTLEMQIPHDDWVRYHTRKSYGMLSDRYDITIRDLIDSSLTQKPDFEAIGEIRLKDMDVLFQSVGTGHGGLTSFHASNPTGAITRMRGNGISDGEIALLWFVVHSRTIDLEEGRVRRVEDISEVLSDPRTGDVRIECIYKYNLDIDKLERQTEWPPKKYADAIHTIGIKDDKADLQKRITLLNECVKEDANDYKKVFEILERYYKR